METIKEQTASVNIAAGTAPGTYEFADTILDKRFSRCDGVAVHEIEDGGVPAYRIGLKTNLGVAHYSSHKNNWIPGLQTPLNERYKETNLPTGTTTTIVVEVLKQLVVPVSFDMVFRLRA